MAPFDLQAALGPTGTTLVYLTIGVAFGAVLEMAGFGNSRKLAAQFYLRDLTVLKVMFTAIVTAMVLVFGASALGWLDYELLGVNPTYLWPGIVGGLIMGAGFIIGGFCPGTSLVAAATLKLDGIAFVIGVLAGVFAFGETVHLYDGFWNSSYHGRLTLPDWLGLDTGIVVVAVVLMALAMFRGAEWLEAHFRETVEPAPRGPRTRTVRIAAAGGLVAAALATLLIGQPTLEDRWDRIADVQQARLTHREVQIHPGELLGLMNDDALNLVLLDLRPEPDFNLFHLRDARRVDLAEVPSLKPVLLQEPARTVYVLMGNGEAAATEAWKLLTAARVPNVYLLQGGVNGWLDRFPHQHEQCATRSAVTLVSDGSADPWLALDEPFHHIMDRAYGASHQAAAPEPGRYVAGFQFEPKVKLEARKAPKKAGCG
jgi:rhodanese-related sulfurtransferase